MAFYERFFNKTRNLGNNLSNKARDSSEQRRLESEIRQLNREIESIYTELGRRLFDNRVNGTVSEYDEDVQRVIDLKSLIDSKKQRIEEIRSQIVCPNCGRLMPAGTVICTACGKFMVKETAEEIPAIEMHDPEIKYCPICGAANEPDALFCNDCGTPLRTGDTPAEDFDAPAGGETDDPAADADSFSTGSDLSDDFAPAAVEAESDAPAPDAEAAPEYFADSAADTYKTSENVEAIMDELPKEHDLDAVVDELIADVHAASENNWSEL